MILEAMSHGLPIIGSTISGLPEVVHDGENGYLVQPGDSRDLATAMERLMNDADLESFGRASQRIVAEHFDVRRNVALFLETVSDRLTRRRTDDARTAV